MKAASKVHGELVALRLFTGPMYVNKVLRVTTLQESAAQPAFGLWRVCFPPCLVRPGRRLPVQGLNEGSLGFRDRLPA